MQPQAEPLAAPGQMEIFSVDQVEGYARLDAKSRKFVQALFEGCSQRVALERAGVVGNDEYLDSAASKLVRTAKVQSVMNQAWAKAGASIDSTLRQAAEIQARAFAAWQEGETPEKRESAFSEWRQVTALLASIHGKLSLKIDTTNTVNVNHTILTPQLQEQLVMQRRQVVVALENPTPAGVN